MEHTYTDGTTSKLIKCDDRFYHGQYRGISFKVGKVPTGTGRTNKRTHWQGYADSNIEPFKYDITCKVKSMRIAIYYVETMIDTYLDGYVS